MCSLESPGVLAYQHRVQETESRRNGRIAYALVG